MKKIKIIKNENQIKINGCVRRIYRGDTCI